MSRLEDELEGFLTDELPQPPLDRQTIAVRVAALLRKYRALDHWREMVRVAWAESDQRNRACSAWELRRQEYFLHEAAKQRRRRMAGRPGVPPTSDWPLETERVCFRGGREERVSAYPPPELRSNERPASGSLLPLRWPLSVAGCYAILAAIHDATLNGVEHINPWMVAGQTTPLSRGVTYQILLDKTRELPASEAASLDVALLRVEDDLEARGSGLKKRGRSRLTPARMAQYQEIKERWERAKGAGVSKEQFCEDQQISAETLDTALRTCRKNSRRN